MMKRMPLLILLIAVTLLSCHPRRKGGGSGSADTASLVVPLASTPLFYTQLKGKVGDKDITMQLLKTAPNLFRGYYRYDSAGQPVALWGTLDSGLVNIYEETTTDEDRLFSGYMYDDGKFKGVWHGDGTSYHFELYTDLKQTTPLKVYSLLDSVKLFPGAANSPMGTVFNSIIWPDSSVDPQVASFLINQITDGRGKDPFTYLKKGVDSFALAYKVSAKDVDTAELSSGASWNWSTEGVLLLPSRC